MKALILSSLLPPLLFLLTSCDGDQKELSETPKTEEPLVWKWNDYPRSTELNLGTMRVAIQPKQSLEIKGENSGVLTINVQKRVTPVPKDFVWAQMDVQELTEQEKRHEIAQTARLLNEFRQENIDTPEQKKEARKQLEEARRKVRAMEMILRSPAMLEVSNELLGGDIGTVSENALSEAKADLALLEKKAAFVEKFETKLKEDEAELKEMDLAKTERSLEEAKNRSVYTIPFDGELRLELPFVEGQSEYNVIPREVLATINDYTEIHAYLTVANANWINLNPNTLYLQLQDRDKTTMSFLDDRVQRDERSRQEERKYVFSVNLDGNEGLKRLTGTQINSELFAKLSKPAYIIPKLDVSLYALGKTKTLEWDLMVDQLWPGAKVIAEGMSSLAIDYIPAQAANQQAQ